MTAAKPAPLKGGAFLAAVRRFLEVRRAEQVAKAELSKLKPPLVEAVDAAGTLDDKGHITVELSEAIDGYAALRNERRSGQLDRDVAERICTEHRLAERCSDTYIHFAKPDKVIAFLRRTTEGARLLEASGQRMVVWDPVVIRGLGEAGEFTDDEMAEMLPAVWALVPVKAPAS